MTVRLVEVLVSLLVEGQGHQVHVEGSEDRRKPGEDHAWRAPQATARFTGASLSGGKPTGVGGDERKTPQVGIVLG